VQGALVPPPCEPAFSRQGAVRGRASWPRLRRHLADKIGLPLPKDDRGAVLIKNPQDVTRSSVELYPEDSGFFRFLKNRKKIINFCARRIRNFFSEKEKSKIWRSLRDKVRHYFAGHPAETL